LSIVAKSPTVLDQLEKIISFLGPLCILCIGLDIIGFRMGILPGFIAISALHFMFMTCGLVCVTGLGLVICRYISSRTIGVELVLLLLLLSLPVVAKFNVLGASLKPSHLSDVSTDIKSPPQFTYAGGLRHSGDNSLDPQLAEYSIGLPAEIPGVDSLTVDVPLREAFRRASYVVALQGWAVVREDLAAGCIEAVSVSPIMGFESDVIIRVVPINDSSSIVDMRSSSRDVKDDYGLNTQQIKRFLSKYRAL
jgi:hypothetical protein